MDVKQEFLRLKEWSICSSGEERSQADSALDVFLSRLTEEDKKQVFEAIDEDLASLHVEVEDVHLLQKKIHCADR